MEDKNIPIIEHILQLHGVDISKYEDTFLTNSIQNRMSKINCHSLEGYINHIQNNIEESESFINSLQISYTEFFRNTLTFSVLEKIILPSLVTKSVNSNRNEIRIWSAACASGQETYSMAMLLQEFSNSKGGQLNFRIFATDQSETQIQEAKLGQYSETELNSLNLKQLGRWFTKQGEIYRIKPELKENIDFSVFDLLNETLSCPPSSIYGNFDLVICANLLFYYQPEYRKKIIEKARHCISRSGYLITGESEREILIQAGFREVYPMSGIFQK